MILIDINRYLLILSTIRVLAWLMGILDIGNKDTALAWNTYEELGWQDKKIMGDQFVRATDSFGANIVEGYSRFHFLDKIKFLYVSRASLAEANDYWIELLLERKKITPEKYKNYKESSDKASIKLQNFISSIYRAKGDAR